ncbi:MAG: iron-sulfur cluster carrier protein ApbC [Alphaproteobacteria bacterium]
MAQVTEDKILAALRSVANPTGDGDVVSDGLIAGIIIKDGNVGFSLEIEADQAKTMEPARKACEEAVRDLPGVTSVTAVLTAERAPQGGAAPQNAPQSAPQGRGGPGGGPGGGRGGSNGGAPHAQGGGDVKQPLPGVGAIVAVASGKGGVGKSTVAINLAMALKTSGLKVGILDADIYGPSLPRMLGIGGRPNAPDGKKIEPLESYGVKAMSMGFLVDEETPMIWRGPMVQGALEQMLRDVLWAPIDVLVVDMPPGTGDAQLTMAQRVPLAGAVIVSTPQDIALLDARKGLNMFRKVEVPVLGIVENMSYFLCPHCNERSEIFGHGGARETAARLDVDFLGEVPLHISIRETSDNGQPIVVTQPDSPYAQIFRDIAAKVMKKIGDGDGRRTPPKIVIS